MTPTDGLPAATRQDTPSGARATTSGRSASPGRSGPEPERPTATTPRFPNLRPPTSGASVPPPPPRASARFPDAAPNSGAEARQDTQGTAVPPRPSTPPRRTPERPETAAETTFSLRPIRPEPTTPARPAPPGTPPRPTTAPAPSPEGRRGAPARPDTRPVGTPTDPFDRSARPGDTARPAPATPSPRHPDPSLSWSAPLTPGETHGSGRPVVSFGQPEGYDEQARPRPLGGRGGMRTAAVAVCLVLGLGLIGGAVTGSWLVGDSAAAGARDTFAAASGMWHSVPVDQLFPPTVQGQGAGPGGADRTWTRIAVAPDSGCADAFDPLLRKALAPVGCQRLLRATYTDATQSYVTTVGLLFTKADAAGMTALDTRFDKEGLGSRADLMPLPYAAKDTAAADFGPKQRASWALSVLTEAPVVVYAVSGWADGRAVDEPQPAAQAMASGATGDIAQAGLGNEAQGLADRVERGFRQTVSSATEKPS
ncbi:hypothetical protein [Streptomyces sp. NPDC046909]|uniref:hypothetical protein n=1 Tax=Streptomyces sp. NPDC046909 TaxID=3155617 RepID=UPI0033FC4CCB